jgi:hypothetical protein
VAAASPAGSLSRPSRSASDEFSSWPCTDESVSVMIMIMIRRTRPGTLRLGPRHHAGSRHLCYGDSLSDRPGRGRHRCGRSRYSDAAGRPGYIAAATHWQLRRVTRTAAGRRQTRTTRSLSRSGGRCGFIIKLSVWLQLSPGIPTGTEVHWQVRLRV